MKSKAFLICMAVAVLAAAADVSAGPRVRISPAGASQAGATAQQGKPAPVTDVRYVCPQCRKQIKRDPAKPSGFMSKCPHCGGTFLSF